MKKLLVSLFVILSVKHTYGQEPKHPVGYQEGYIVTTSNDTIYGEIKYFNLVPLKFLTNIKFRPSNDTTQRRYSPKKSISFKAGNKRFEYVDYPYGYDIKRGYMEILVDGYLKLYTVDVAQLTSTGYKTFINFIEDKIISMKFLKKGSDRKVIDLSNGSFKSTVSRYLKDYPELSGKIKKGVYRPKDIEQIIEEYNIWWYNQSQN